MIAAGRTRIRSPLVVFARFFNSNVAEKCSKLVPKFEAALGAANVIVAESQREQFSHDEGHFPFYTPDLVVRPGSTEEVAAILRLCNEQKIPVCPSGTRTGIEGAAIPLHKGVVVDMLRMNEVLRVNEADFDCEVQPGVTRQALNTHIRDTGLFFSVDPGADASIGGMIATGASGTTSVRYGTMKNNVKNLEVVLADGRVIHTKGEGRRPWKSSAGYNLTELFVGSEATLGVVTSAVVSLHARPQAISAAVCPFPSVDKAVETVVNLRQLALPLSRIEFLDEHQMAASIAFSRLEMPAKPTLFLEFHGATEEEVGRQAETAKEVCESNDALDFKWSVDADRINELWKARHTAYYAVLAQKPGARGFSTDVCVPLSRLVEVVRKAHDEMAALRLKGAIVGHVGEGNFHCLFACSEENVEEMRTIWRFSDRLIKHALAVGGTCTGEHGVGMGKRQYLQEEFGDVTLGLMRTLKKTLDPNGILNPGKMFPEFNDSGVRIPLHE
ncbi:FAD-binding PCMH-type domain-containing protein [Aphelenchoides fujianensis]|nr:FAD-binding PCMH-type domain-containing protein [Aphelenchoides fujianensis]